MNKAFIAVALTVIHLVLFSAVFGDPPRDVEGELVIHFIDVGQGDASFIELPDGTNMLIDAGSPAAGPKLVKYLRALHIKKINRLIVTHPHDDHIGGIFSLLSAFEIEHFYDNGFSNFQSNLYFDYVAAVRNNLSTYGVLQAGESMTSGSITIEVLNPLLPPTGNLNNDSIVLQLVYGDISILFAGDASASGEARLLKATSGLKSRVLKVAHHGANDALSEEFLEAVSPEAAILSVAMISRYARPHQSVTGRLSERSIKTFRTDLHGTVVLRSDGKIFSITADK